MSRTNQVLSLALIVQIVLGILLFIPNDSDSSRAAGPLLAEFEPDKVVNLTIQDTNDNTVVLHKTDQGDWVLSERDNYPAQNSRIQQLLSGLQGINRNRVIARNSSSYKRLGVSGDEYERLIEVELEDGGTRTIYLGTSAGASAAHVRLGDEDTVYLTGALAAWEVPAQLTSWIDTTYFSVPRDNIVTLQIENPNGTFQLQKHEDSWTLVGLADDETFDPESVTSLLGHVSSIRMTEPIGKEADPAWNMDDPVVKITVTVEETVAATENADTEAESPSIDNLLPTTPTPGASAASPTQAGEANAGDATEEPETETVETTYELKLGQQLEDRGYPLISSESEFYVNVPTTTAEPFLNLTREDFLIVEPEEDAGTTPSDVTPTPQASDAE